MLPQRGAIAVAARGPYRCRRRAQLRKRRPRANNRELTAREEALNWSMLHLPERCISVADSAFDGPPPRYLRPEHAQYQDWGVCQQLPR